MTDNIDNSDISDNTPEHPDHLDQESLQRQLNEYQAAIQAEFEMAQEAKPDDTIENTLEYFQKNVPLACAQIVYLATHSTSDSTRLSASKYIIDRVFKGSVDSPHDPLKAIFDSLRGPESETPKGELGVSPHED